MELTETYTDSKREIAELFKATFTASEGSEEGAVIGALVERLFASTDARDIFVFSAVQAGALAGAAIFTRMRYPQDERSVFILSPMAVSTAHQGTGIGQKLLTFGLNRLRETGVDVALTYGDINFYSKVGFKHISSSDVKPPLPLTYPEGWLGQSLTGRPLDQLHGSSICVEALSNPELW